MTTFKTLGATAPSGSHGAVAHQLAEALTRMLAAEWVTLGAPILLGDAEFLILLVCEQLNGRMTYRGTLTGTLAEMLADQDMEFRLVTDDGRVVGAAVIGTRGRLTVPIDRDAPTSNCRCHMELVAADAEPGTSVARNSQGDRTDIAHPWSYAPPTGVAAKGRDDVPQRKRIDVRGNIVFVDLAPDDAPSGCVLVWVSEGSRPDVPVGSRQLVQVSIKQSLSSGAYRSGEIALNDLLPPGITFDANRHQIEVISVRSEAPEMGALLTPSQRELVQNWIRGAADDRMVHTEPPALGRVLPADSAGGLEDGEDRHDSGHNESV